MQVADVFGAGLLLYGLVRLFKALLGSVAVAAAVAVAVACAVAVAAAAAVADTARYRFWRGVARKMLARYRLWRRASRRGTSLLTVDNVWF